MRRMSKDAGNILPFKHISIKPLNDYEIILNKATISSNVINNLYPLWSQHFD